MTHPLQHPFLRAARRALVLGGALAGLGSIAGAAPKPKPRPHHKSEHAAGSTATRKRAAKSHRAKTSADSADDLALPTLPPIVLLPSADLTLGSESLRLGESMTQPFTQASTADVAAAAPTSP